MNHQEILVTDLVGAMTQVRKAYRLLHDYQRAVLDMVQYIAKTHFQNMEFYYTVPRYQSRKQSTPPFEYWAWDWLNMSRISYIFTLKNQDEHWLAKRDTSLLAIEIISDTAVNDWKNDREAFSADLDKVCPVDEAESLIRISKIICVAESEKREDWLHAFKELGAEYFDEKFHSYPGNENFKMVGITVAMQDMLNKESVDNVIVSFKDKTEAIVN
jgi:hypothetical protein